LATCFIPFLPAFCFSNHLRFRVTSPPRHLAVTCSRRGLRASRATTRRTVAVR
jgi:hypothetical protein